MCGRYSLSVPQAALLEQFQVARNLVPRALLQRYNIAPGQQIAAVRMAQDGVRELVPLRWGLIPHWAKEAKLEYSTINARAETVAEKPAFRAAFRHRRCLIPASGFYEWQVEVGGKRKQPWYICRADGGIFAFAGLWERWQSQEQIIESCTILVTEANELLRPIHDRMPVILDLEHYPLWLDSSQSDFKLLKSLLKPYSAQTLTAWKVSLYVNNPKNDDPACLKPVG